MNTPAFLAKLRNNFSAEKVTFSLFKLIIFFTIGLVCIVASVLTLSSFKIDPNWKSGVGTIIGSSFDEELFSKSYIPLLDYEVNGAHYQVVSDTGTSKQPEPGKQQSIVYNPSNPSQARVVQPASHSYLAWGFLIGGVVIAVGSIILFGIARYNDQPGKNTKQTGRKVRGAIMGIEADPTSSKKRYRVIAVALDASGKARRFTSEWIAGVSKIAAIDFRKNRVHIDVYLDRTDLKKYYVDVDEISGLTAQGILAKTPSAPLSNPSPKPKI
jgi:hypothetical protein